MAKPLTKEPPSSSVIGMLDPAVGAAALKQPTNIDLSVPTPITNQLPAPAAVPRRDPSAERDLTNVLRQFSLTGSTEDTLKELVNIYSKASGMNLKASEILRSVLIALRHSLPELQREASRIGKLKRAKYEKGIVQEFEKVIARAIVAGMRAADMME